mmetsp:Transcript_11912/g.27818  ORF Transcript_11912/g.27818 Transcript_11912/m.27818 type:complete len:203 (+) Transcript_11912:1512-2120(+)
MRVPLIVNAGTAFLRYSTGPLPELQCSLQPKDEKDLRQNGQGDGVRKEVHYQVPWKEKRTTRCLDRWDIYCGCSRNSSALDYEQGSPFGYPVDGNSCFQDVPVDRTSHYRHQTQKRVFAFVRREAPSNLCDDVSHTFLDHSVPSSHCHCRRNAASSCFFDVVLSAVEIVAGARSVHVDDNPCPGDAVAFHTQSPGSRLHDGE